MDERIKKAFIGYSLTIDDAYKNIEDYSVWWYDSRYSSQ